MNLTLPCVMILDFIARIRERTWERSCHLSIHYSIFDSIHGSELMIRDNDILLRHWPGKQISLVI